jgi:hypothetical protein
MEVFGNVAVSSGSSSRYIQCGAGVTSFSGALSQLIGSFSGGQSFDAGTIRHYMHI